MSARVEEILSWYGSDSPGTLAKLYRMLMHGRLAGTGKLCVLPVDQGFEHGPARSFAPNPLGYDPRYHMQMALEGGFSAYACPLGAMEIVAREYAGQMPLILKCNSHESLHGDPEPLPAITATIDDALRLGCDAIGFTIYPGSARAIEGYEQLRELTAEAKAAGLVVVVWSYPRGGDLSSVDETALDVVAYAAQIACQLGAHIVKVKPPTDDFSSDTFKDLYKTNKIASATLAQRISHVVQSAFDGRRVIIFSGGAKASDKEIVDMAKAIKDGGGFGSIMGRNIFQRPQKAALKLAADVMKVYASK